MPVRSRPRCPQWLHRRAARCARNPAGPSCSNGVILSLHQSDAAPPSYFDYAKTRHCSVPAGALAHDAWFEPVVTDGVAELHLQLGERLVPEEALPFETACVAQIGLA